MHSPLAPLGSGRASPMRQRRSRSVKVRTIGSRSADRHAFRGGQGSVGRKRTVEIHFRPGRCVGKASAEGTLGLGLEHPAWSCPSGSDPLCSSCVWIVFVDTSLCPISSCTVLMSVPFSSRRVAKQCRNVWQCRPAFAVVERQRRPDRGHQRLTATAGMRKLTRAAASKAAACCPPACARRCAPSGPRAPCRARSPQSWRRWHRATRLCASSASRCRRRPRLALRT